MDNKTQTWITIDECSNYEISSTSQVRNKITNHIMKIDEKHNNVVYLIKDKVKKTLSVPKLLRKYFPVSDLPNEVWRDFPDNITVYEISSLGRIRNKINLNILNPFPLNGYLAIGLSVEGKNTQYFVHRITLRSFLEADNPDQITVNHKNGNKHDNRLENLEWASYKEQAEHARDTGLVKGFKRAVRQIDRTSNQIIKEFESILDASRKTGIESRNINSACAGNLPGAGGFDWKYVNERIRIAEIEDESDNDTSIKEVWKQFQNTNYKISSLGRVGNIITNNLLTIQTYASGRLYIIIRIDGKQTHYLISRLVAITHIPNPNELPEVDHIDENPTNNTITNLRWVTSQKNVRHSKAKSVDQLGMNGSLVKNWECIADAAKFLKCNAGNISKCCLGTRGSCSEYKWRYTTENDSGDDNGDDE